MKSSTYTSLVNCEKSISLARVLGIKRDSYSLSNSVNGSYYFFLISKSRAIIATSESYHSESTRNDAIESIIKALKKLDSVSPVPSSLNLIEFVKDRRKRAGLSQDQLAEKAGVGIRFLRELEQGKDTLRLDKVNQVLKMFGHEMQPVPVKQEIE